MCIYATWIKSHFCSVSCYESTWILCFYNKFLYPDSKLNQLSHVKKKCTCIWREVRLRGIFGFWGFDPIFFSSQYNDRIIGRYSRKAISCPTDTVPVNILHSCYCHASQSPSCRSSNFTPLTIEVITYIFLILCHHATLPAKPRHYTQFLYIGHSLFLSVVVPRCHPSANVCKPPIQWSNTEWIKFGAKMSLFFHCSAVGTEPVPIINDAFIE